MSIVTIIRTFIEKDPQTGKKLVSYKTEDVSTPINVMPNGCQSIVFLVDSAIYPNVKINGDIPYSQYTKQMFVNYDPDCRIEGVFQLTD